MADNTRLDVSSARSCSQLAFEIAIWIANVISPHSFHHLPKLRHRLLRRVLWLHNYFGRDSPLSRFRLSHGLLGGLHGVGLGDKYRLGCCIAGSDASNVQYCVIQRVDTERYTNKDAEWPLQPRGIMSLYYFCHNVSILSYSLKHQSERTWPFDHLSFFSILRPGCGTSVFRHCF